MVVACIDTSGSLEQRRDEIINIAKKECNPDKIVYFNNVTEGWELESIFNASAEVGRTGHVVVYTDHDITYLPVYNKLRSLRNVHIVFLDDENNDIWEALRHIQD